MSIGPILAAFSSAMSNSQQDGGSGRSSITIQVGNVSCCSRNVRQKNSNRRYVFYGPTENGEKEGGNNGEGKGTIAPEKSQSVFIRCISIMCCAKQDTKAEENAVVRNQFYKHLCEDFSPMAADVAVGTYYEKQACKWRSPEVLASDLTDREIMAIRKHAEEAQPIIERSDLYQFLQTHPEMMTAKCMLDYLSGSPKPSLSTTPRENSLESKSSEETISRIKLPEAVRPREEDDDEKVTLKRMLAIAKEKPRKRKPSENSDPLSPFSARQSLYRAQQATTKPSISKMEEVKEESKNEIDYAIDSHVQGEHYKVMLPKELRSLTSDVENLTPQQNQILFEAIQKKRVKVLRGGAPQDSFEEKPVGPKVTPNSLSPPNFIAAQDEEPVNV